MGNSRIDWSSLDPSRDAERWNRLVESIADRALARHKQRLTISYQLVAWFGPVLAMAAAVTLVMGARVLFAHNHHSHAITNSYQRAYTLAQWAEAEEHPPTSNVLQLFEEPNVDK